MDNDKTAQPTGVVRRERNFSLMPTSLGEAKELAAMIAHSNFAPKQYAGKPDDILIAVQMGADLGLKPMQALQNIAVINGRPSIYGDAALALCMPALERFVEAFEGDPKSDEFAAVCIAKRKGWPDETRRTFSIADAKGAGLLGKSGPWTQYRNRMMQFRARGFALRDSCADLLLGLVLAEEAMDYPVVEGAVVTVDTVAAPVDLLGRVSEGVQDRLGKAFEALNMSAAQKLAKINEFLGGDGVDPEEGAVTLLEWCKDEWAKRKSGKPRAKGGNGNAKTAAEKTAAPVADPVVVETPLVLAEEIF